MKKICFLFLLTVCFVSPSFSDDDFKPSMGKSEYDSSKIEAYLIYAKSKIELEKMGFKQLKKINLSEDLKKIENKLIYARNLVNEDTDSLEFVIKKKQVQQAGRWAKYKNIELSYTREYYPNYLIKEIRKRLNPFVVGKVSFEQKNFMKLTLVNKGNTTLEDLRASLLHSGMKKNKNFGDLSPNSSKSMVWEWDNKGSDPTGLVQINIKERYNFTPPAISFNIGSLLYYNDP